MTVTLRIKRKAPHDEARYEEDFLYEQTHDGDTVASALRYFDNVAELVNADGKPTRRIQWECSCLQKKCGACAMVVDGKPRLACDALLKDSRTGVIRVEPLRKFPVFADLVVDRSILMENLKTMRAWLATDAELSERDRATAYASSECLQCGLCLEVCPNFFAGGKFFGMAAGAITTRLLVEADRAEVKRIAKAYAAHVFAGCGKSLACRNVCPRHIDTENLLVNANAVAVWKRRRRKG